jgi:hypothetical protein
LGVSLCLMSLQQHSACCYCGSLGPLCDTRDIKMHTYTFCAAEGSDEVTT